MRRFSDDRATACTKVRHRQDPEGRQPDGNSGQLLFLFADMLDALNKSAQALRAVFPDRHGHGPFPSDWKSSRADRAILPHRHHGGGWRGRGGIRARKESCSRRKEKISTSSHVC
jgi:hypothetical protein